MAPRGAVSAVAGLGIAGLDDGRGRPGPAIAGSLSCRRRDCLRRESLIRSVSLAKQSMPG
jgi:hypothetical protein